VSKYLKQFGAPARLKHIGISAFLLFHIVAITCWCVPLESPLIDAFRSVVRPYLLWSGLFQSWDMFAPSPKTLNGYVEAVVIYKDGSIRNWAFPRMEHLTARDRYSADRYRKFVENLKEDRSLALWPDAARHIAWLNNNRSSPPEMVILVRHWSEIVPRFNAAYQPEPWHAEIFYEYKVQPADLQ
jgi:hypothetical protein